MVHINTTLQLGDAFTKALGHQALEPHLDSLFVGIPTTGTLLKLFQTTYQLRHSGTRISSQPTEIYQPEWKLNDEEGF
jgi:hypothetical protein